MTTGPTDGELPTLAKRFGALLIDWVLCLLVSNFFGDPLRDGWPPVLVLILEYGFFVGLFAQTRQYDLQRLVRARSFQAVPCRQTCHCGMLLEAIEDAGPPDVVPDAVQGEAGGHGGSGRGEDREQGRQPARRPGSGTVTRG